VPKVPKPRHTRSQEVPASSTAQDRAGPSFQQRSPICTKKVLKLAWVACAVTTKIRTANSKYSKFRIYCGLTHVKKKYNIIYLMMTVLSMDPAIYRGWKISIH